METNKMTAFLDASPGMLLKLKPETLPVWGMMTAQHMVEHLSSALIMSIKNTVHHEQPNQEVILRHKTHMLSNGFTAGTGRGDGKLKDLKCHDLVSAADQYAVNLKAFSEALRRTVLSTSHFYFGPLKNEEWLTFHYWHIRHHFKQFGIL